MLSRYFYGNKNSETQGRCTGFLKVGNPSEQHLRVSRREETALQDHLGPKDFQDNRCVLYPSCYCTMIYTSFRTYSPRETVDLMESLVYLASMASQEALGDLVAKGPRETPA